MIAYIPLANCQAPSEEALDSLSRSYLIKTVWVHPTKEHWPKHDRRRYAAIAENRKRIFDIATKLDEKYFLMINSDRILLEGELEKMVKFMDENLDFGAASVDPHHHDIQTGHIGLEIMLIRTVAVKGIKMDVDKLPCDCAAFCREVRNGGYKVGYV